VKVTFDKRFGQPKTFGTAMRTSNVRSRVQHCTELELEMWR